jgi:hypothetical protein
VSTSETPAGHGDKKSAGKSWNQMPRTSRSMASRQKREWDTGGRGRGLQTHGSHRKKQSSLRLRSMDAIAGAFSYSRCYGAMWVVCLGHTRCWCCLLSAQLLTVAGSLAHLSIGAWMPLLLLPLLAGPETQGHGHASLVLLIGSR